MKKVFIILFLLISYKEILSQGFDWQYSARLPFSTPVFFIGPSASLNYNQNSGDIILNEGEYQDCCSFKNGNGFGYNLGFKSEYWITGLSAIFSQLSYFQNNADFKARGRIYPLNDSTNLITENDFSSQISYLNLSIGYKYRLDDTHFNLGAGLNFNLLLSQNSQHFEKIIAPSDFYFNTNPPSQIRQLTQFKTSELSNILIYPSIHIGYDLNLGLGIYSNIQLIIGIPLNHITKNDDWSKWNFDVNISILKGLFY